MTLAAAETQPSVRQTPPASIAFKWFAVFVSVNASARAHSIKFGNENSVANRWFRHRKADLPFSGAVAHISVAVNAIIVTAAKVQSTSNVFSNALRRCQQFDCLKIGRKRQLFIGISLYSQGSQKSMSNSGAYWLDERLILVLPKKKYIILSRADEQKKCGRRNRRQWQR